MDGRLRTTLDRLTEKKVPGLSAVVVRPGSMDSLSSGSADISGAKPATEDTIYLWFSMTKIATATAVMQLYERGVLDLDDPVSRFLPSFPSPRRGWPEVRIRHLLSHSAGLPNPIPVKWVHPAGASGRDPHAFASELLLRHSKLRFPAGSRAVYSNLGYISLGEVIAAASGTTYEEHVRSQILEPLKMRRTAFLYDGLGDDIATGYQPRFSPMTPLFRLMLPPGIAGEKTGRFLAFNRFYVDGAAYGGLIGSANDAARFLAVHVGDGALDGVRLLSPASVREMRSTHATGRKLDVGFGWFCRGADRSRDDRHVEHLGGGGGFWNMMRIYPDRDLGVVVMGNTTSYDHDAVARALDGGN